MQPLPELAELYLASKIVCRDHAAQIRRVAARCGRLTPQSVNEYLRNRLSAVSAITARNERSQLLAIWRFAYESEIVDAMPRGIVKIKPPGKPTRAWTVEQMQSLVQHASREPGILRSGIRKSEMLQAWILIGYASGARFGDIWRFREDNIDGSVLRWTQNKTGEPISKTLDEPTLMAVRRVSKHSVDGTLLGWACSRGQAMRIMRAFLDKYGLDGSSKWLRRSGATHVEMSQPGFGRHHCGHKTASMVEKHYLDWGQIRRNAPVPPSLVTAK